MTVSQFSALSRATLKLLQPLNQVEHAKTASDTTIEMIKASNGITNAPSAAAKQASTLVVNFAMNHSSKSVGQMGDEPESIVMVGIGGGEAVERFGSWEELETRILEDQKMDQVQKDYWLKKVSLARKDWKEIAEFKRSAFYQSLVLGEHQKAIDAAINSYLAESGVHVDVSKPLDLEPVYRLYRRMNG